MRAQILKVKIHLSNFIDTQARESGKALSGMIYVFLNDTRSFFFAP